MPELPDLKFEIIYDFKPYELKVAPIGWDKLDKSGGLDDFYLTIQEKVNSELRFIYDGADVLRKIMLTKGANSKALVRISKRNVITNEYSVRIRQNVDFQKFSDRNGIVTVGFLEKSVAANIKAFGDVQYSIPVPDDLAVSMNIGGIGVNELVRFIAGPTDVPQIRPNIYAPSLDIIENSTSPDIVTVQSGYDYYSGLLSDFDVVASWAIKNISATPILAQFKGSAGTQNFGTYPDPFVDFFIYDSEGNEFTLANNVPMIIVDEDTGEVGSNAEFDINITMQPGVRYTFVVREQYVSFGTHRVSYVDLTVNYSTYTTDYTVKGLRSFDLYKALLQKMNPNNTLNISAPVLTSGLGARIVVASGDCIRGIANATIQTSFKEFISTFTPQLFAGQMVYDDDSIRFDTFNNIQFNRYAYCGSLGSVKDANYESITQDYASSYNVGYNDNEYDRGNGKDETNTLTQRLVKEALNVNPVEIISTYRADPRGVDQLMIEYRIDPTRDNKGDKQNFQFVINSTPDEFDGLYHLTGPEIFKSVTGTSALGRIYNLELAPIFMFLRNSARVAVQFALAKTGVVDFESSKKNADLVITKFDDTVIAEKMSVSYDQMNAPLYLPLKCTFTAVLTDEAYDTIIASSNVKGGWIDYIDRGQYMKGFLVAYSYNLTQNNIKEFTVYLHPDCDVTKLYKLS